MGKRKVKLYHGNEWDLNLNNYELKIQKFLLRIYNKNVNLIENKWNNKKQQRYGEELTKKEQDKKTLRKCGCQKWKKHIVMSKGRRWNDRKGCVRNTRKMKPKDERGNI